MTPIQALQVLGLEAGEEYTREELREAVHRRKRRAQYIVQHGDTVKAQDDAMEALRKIPEAKKTLEGLIPVGEDTFCVPKGPAVSPAPTAGRTATAGTGSPGQRGAVRSGPSLLRRLVAGIASAGATAWGALTALPKSRITRELAGAVGKVFRAFWLSLKAIAGYTKKKEYARALLTALLVTGLAWGTFTLVTGGVQHFAGKVRRAIRAANDSLSSMVRGEDSVTSSHGPPVEISSDAPDGVIVEIDGESVSDVKTVEGGTHQVRIQARSQTLYSGQLYFPHGGQVGLKESPTGAVELTIRWNGGEQWVVLNTSQSPISR